jgi:molybdate transport system ATP-binding protein
MSFDVDLTIRRGARTIDAAFAAPSGLVALFGRSGAGKTSVLNMVAGLLRPARGHVVVAGARLYDSNAGVDLAPERRRAGYVFQDDRLFPHLSVRANLLYGERLAPPSERWISLPEVTAFLDIAGLLDRRPATLSGGEAQRVAIGRALLAAPRFLLMDEPLASLDAPRREEIIQVIERIRDMLHLPILYVTHDRHEVDRLATQTVVLD